MTKIFYSVLIDFSLEEIRQRIEEMNIAMGISNKLYDDKIWQEHENRKFCHIWLAKSGLSLNIDIHHLPIRNKNCINFSLEAAENIIGLLSKRLQEEIIFYFGEESLVSGISEDSEINIESYRYLNKLENILRKTIENKLKNIYGDKWIEYIPEEIFKKWESKMKSEKGSKWIETNSSLIEYSDFVDTKMIIENPKNWKNCFKEIFGRRKEIIIGKIVELEQLRNKIAHNRNLSLQEFNKFKSYCNEIINCIEE